jgi:hypothetical protein
MDKYRKKFKIIYRTHPNIRQYCEILTSYGIRYGLTPVRLQIRLSDLIEDCIVQNDIDIIDQLCNVCGIDLITYLAIVFSNTNTVTFLLGKKNRIFEDLFFSRYRNHLSGVFEREHDRIDTL